MRKNKKRGGLSRYAAAVLLVALFAVATARVGLSGNDAELSTIPEETTAEPRVIEPIEAAAIAYE